MDDFNLVVRPQVTFYHTTHNSQFLDELVYSNKSLDGKITINGGLMIGAKIGVTNDIFSLLFSVRHSNKSLIPASKILYDDNSKIMEIFDFFHIMYGVEVDYKVQKNFGVGIEYKVDGQDILSVFHGRNEDLSLSFNRWASHLYLNIPMEYRLDKIKLVSKIGYSFLGKTNNMRYKASFSEYRITGQNLYVEAERIINGDLRSFYFQVGINYELFNVLPLELFYEFKTNWVSDDYSEYWNSLTLTIPFGQ